MAVDWAAFDDIVERRMVAAGLVPCEKIDYGRDVDVYLRPFWHPEIRDGKVATVCVSATSIELSNNLTPDEILARSRADLAIMSISKLREPV